MSRVIPNDHLWDEDERAYYLARPGGKELVEQNKRQFGDSAPKASEKKAPEPEEDKKIELDPEVVKKVKALTDEQTRKALAEAGLDTSGDLPEAKKRLAIFHSKKD
jgi:hypothetical protein